MESNNIEVSDFIIKESMETEEIYSSDVKMLMKGDIHRNTVSMGVDTLIEKFNRFDFILPKYQRKFVWSQDQITKLAISVIKNIPIPPIYVYTDTDNKYVILDGQQRVISLFLYCNDLRTVKTKDGKKVLIDFYELLRDEDKNHMTLDEIFTNDPSKNFRKTKYYIDNNTKTGNFTFGELSNEIKRIWGQRFIDVVFLDVKSKNKESVYSNIFNLLNSGGTLLKPQEIRNGVYKSAFYDMLHDLNDKNQVWRNIYGAKHENCRDVEQLLRFLALEYYTKLNDESEIVFKNSVDSKSVYKGSMHLLLDEYSQESLKFDEVEIKDIRIKLERFFSIIDKQIYSTTTDEIVKVNHLMMECMYVVFSMDEKLSVRFDEKLIKDLYDNNKYTNAVKSSTSNKKYIEERLTIVRDECRKLWK
ncbi:MAG: DUF262 domain-containing protein [Nitrososphaeraceae archaeon]